MKTMKLVLFVFASICVFNTLCAKHSDSYLLGNYSYLKAQSNYLTQITALSSKMQEAGYNAAICEITKFSVEADIRNLLAHFLIAQSEFN
ncbi:MAG: hypothetical protein RBS43_10380 [Candidatus Cloacimonas sp.]|jgi:hypothetical protein|nr:hypothetical protein [Candidatus Cloacimonas sp.]